MRRPAVLTGLGQNRDFAILWSGQAVSGLGTSMSMLVFPLIGYAITGSATQAGLATAALMLGGAAARLPAGALIDRWPRDRILLLANLCGAVLFGSLAVAALVHRVTLAQLIGVGLLSGVTDAFAGPAGSAAVRAVVPKAELPVAFSRLQARRHAVDLVGPPAGGALYGIARGLPFVFDTVSYLACALAITRLRTPLPAPPPSGRHVGADMAEGLRFVWREPVVRATMLWGGAVNFAATYALVTITLRLVQAGVRPGAIGLVDSIAAVAGLFGAVLAPAIVRRLPTGLMTMLTGLVFALVLVPTAWTTNVVLIGGLLAIGFLLFPANNSGVAGYLAAVTPEQFQGRMYSASSLIATGVEPAAPALAGVVVGTAGGTVATTVGAVAVAASLLPLLTSSAIRRLGPPDRWPVHADADAAVG